MNINELNIIMGGLHNAIQEVADRIASLALIDSASGKNTAFCQLLDLHDQLVDLSKKLVKRMWALI